MPSSMSQRVNFSGAEHTPNYPDFLDIQIKSFQDFFQLETKSDERNEEGLFNTFKENFPISEKISLRTELHLRTISYFSIWNQQLFRPQLSYRASKNISWRGGYTLLRNFDQDVTKDPRVRNEHNIWEQVQFTLPLKKKNHIIFMTNLVRHHS